MGLLQSHLIIRRCSSVGLRLGLMAASATIRTQVHSLTLVATSVSVWTRSGKPLSEREAVRQNKRALVRESEDRQLARGQHALRDLIAIVEKVPDVQLHAPRNPVLH